MRGSPALGWEDRLCSGACVWVASGPASRTQIPQERPAPSRVCVPICIPSALAPRVSAPAPAVWPSPSGFSEAGATPGPRPRAAGAARGSCTRWRSLREAALAGPGGPGLLLPGLRNGSSQQPKFCLTPQGGLSSPAQP